MPTADGTSKLGPGTLTIGAVGSVIDASCLINNARIVPSKEAADSKTMLCGTVKAGATSYTFQLSGNLDVDSAKDDGLFALSYAERGTEQPFTFTPTDDESATATGVLVLDPLTLGGEEFGEWMASDFEFDLVGVPAFTFPAVAP